MTVFNPNDLQSFDQYLRYIMAKVLNHTDLKQTYCISRPTLTASILIQGCEYNCTMAQAAPKVMHMRVTTLAVCNHCLGVNPCERENCEPFSTMYGAAQTLHLSVSGLSAL